MDVPVCFRDALRKNDEGTKIIHEELTPTTIARRKDVMASMKRIVYCILII